MITDYNYFIEPNNWFFLLFIAGTFLLSVSNNILDYMNSLIGNINERIKDFHKINPLLKKYFSASRIKKCHEYENAHLGFSDFSSSIESSIVSILTIVGVMPFLIHTLMGYTGNMYYTYMLFVTIMCISKKLFNLPFSYFATFSIEQRFGFNNSSKSLFFKDVIKSTIIGTLLTSVIVCAMNYALTSFGYYKSVNICYLVLGIFVVQMIFEALYMSFGLRIFNKLTPLKNKSLEKSIKNLYHKCGYKKVPKLFIMDSSIRSSHGNAFIGGFWKFKKIVLFDTLLKNHSNSEILAILAHEIGHDKNHDMIKGRILSMTDFLITTFIVFSLIYNVNMYHAFGFYWITEENVIQYSLIGFNIAMMIIGAVKWILEPMYSYLSRKAEYKADSYSAIHTSKKAMTESLIKLSSDNLSNPFVSPIYEFWNYDHPSLINRIRNIEKTKMTKKRKN